VAYRKDYYAKNHDRMQARNKAWNLLNGDRIRSWAKKHPERTHEQKVHAMARRRSRELSLPATLTQDEWQKTLAVFGGRCAYCDTDGTMWRDHFIPITMGGGYEAGNILPACPSCNRRKWQHSPLKFLGIQKYAEIMLRIHGA
jgi:5-methylcytosine-specific restriction endonuclease McrA